MQLNQRRIMLALGSIGAAFAATQLIRGKSKRGAVAVGAVTIHAEPAEVFAFLSDPEISAYAFHKIDAITESQIEPHRPNEILAWEQRGKARASAALRPAPGTRGTEIHLTVRGDTKERLKAGLRRFKALVEAGEVPTGERA